MYWQLEHRIYSNTYSRHRQLLNSAEPGTVSDRPAKLKGQKISESTSATGTHRRPCFRLRHSNGSGKDTDSVEELTRIGELKSSGPTCSFSYPGYTPGLMYVHIDERMRTYIPLIRLTVPNCSASHTLPFEESRKVNRASSGAGEMSVIWSPEYARQTRILHLYTCTETVFLLCRLPTPVWSL
jgi:hypothetical protein